MTQHDVVVVVVVVVEEVWIFAYARTLSRLGPPPPAPPHQNVIQRGSLVWTSILCCTLMMCCSVRCSAWIHIPFWRTDCVCGSLSFYGSFWGGGRRAVFILKWRFFFRFVFCLFAEIVSTTCSSGVETRENAIYHSATDLLIVWEWQQRTKLDRFIQN